jgi:hypothetical protein
LLCFTFSSLNQKSQQNLILTISFRYVLRVVGAWQLAELVGDAKLFVVAAYLKSEEKINLRLSREFDNYPSHFCGQNFSCYILCTWSPRRVTFWRIELLSSISIQYVGFFFVSSGLFGGGWTYLTRPLCHGVYLGFLNYKLVWRSIYRDLIRLSSYSETVTMQVWPWVYQKHFLDTVIL